MKNINTIAVAGVILLACGSAAWAQGMQIGPPGDLLLLGLELQADDFGLRPPGWVPGGQHRRRLKQVDVQGGDLGLRPPGWVPGGLHRRRIKPPDQADNRPPKWVPGGQHFRRLKP